MPSGSVLDLAPEGRVYRWTAVGSSAFYEGEPVWLRVSPFLASDMGRRGLAGRRRRAP